MQSNNSSISISEAMNCTVATTGHFGYNAVELIIKWLIFCYVMVSNLLLITGLPSTKLKKKLTMMKKLFVLLSCIDILTISLFVLHNYLEEFEAFNAESIVGAISMALYLVGGTIFLTISILRYISVRYPFKRVSNRKVYMALVLAFILGAMELSIMRKKNFLSEK